MGSYAPVTTLAKTSTSTRFAPALSSALALALAVAPEVKTSSTSTTLSPRSDRALGDSERALDIFGPLRSAHAHLAACRLDAPKRGQIARFSRSARDLRRQRGRLVELPSPQPQGVQRHRRQEIGVGQNVGAGASHPACDRPGELRAVGIFEPMHERAGGSVLEPRHGPGAAERRRIGHRLRRDEALAKIVLERRAKALAKGPLDEAHGAPAARAQRAVLVGGGAAGKARRRIKRVERGASQIRGERASAARPRQAVSSIPVEGRRGVHGPQVSANRSFARGAVWRIRNAHVASGAAADIRSQI